MNNNTQCSTSILDGLTLEGDLFGGMVLENAEAFCEVHRQVTGEEIEIDTICRQEDTKNGKGKSIRTDVSAITTSGRKIVIELQRDLTKWSDNRLQYYIGMLQTATLEPGNKYNVIPSITIIVLFGRHDNILDPNKPYKSNPHCNGEQIYEHPWYKHHGNINVYYVDLTKRMGNDLDNFFQDFFEPNPDKIYNPIVAKYIKLLKRGEQRPMLEKGVDDFVKIHLDEAIKNLLNKGIDVETIMDSFGYTREEVLEVAKKNNINI